MNPPYRARDRPLWFSFAMANENRKSNYKLTQNMKGNR